MYSASDKPRKPLIDIDKPGIALIDQVGKDKPGITLTDPDGIVERGITLINRRWH